jgi:hypothetical protein
MRVTSGAFTANVIATDIPYAASTIHIVDGVLASPIALPAPAPHIPCGYRLPPIVCVFSTNMVFELVRETAQSEKASRRFWSVQAAINHVFCKTDLIWTEMMHN